MNGSTTTVTPSNRVDLIDTQGGRILCVADVRGKLSTLNDLAKEHNAQAIIHTGDFGFYEPASLSKITDRTLKHLVQYSAAISTDLRQSLMNPSLSPSQLRQMLTNPHQPTLDGKPDPQAHSFPLSEFPKLLTGELKLNVPVYTVWGACEDVSVLERLRVAPPGPVALTAQSSSTTASQPNWSIPNLTVLSESSTRALVIGGVRFRLFGLGGACVAHKMFDNGEGQATIAGGGGTMWTTILQIGELIDTAARVYDPAETRVLVTHASPGREGILAQLALALKADITISASLHFRYGASYNEFSTHHDPESYKNKFLYAKASFEEIWATVKPQVESVIDEGQRKFLNNALAVTSRVPGDAASANGGQVEEAAWKNTWNWNLPDANFGSLILDIRDGRVSSEQRSQGFNFSYRAGAGAPSGPSNKNSVAQPTRPPSAPRAQQQSQQSQQQQRGNFAPNPQKPYPQQNRDQPFRKENRREQNKSVASETSSKPPADTPNRSESPAAKPAEGDKDKPTQPASPQIDRPASSASSRRSSHHKGKSIAADDKPSAPGAENAGGDSDASRGRGGFRGRGGNRGGRGGFEGKPASRGSNPRGGRGGHFERSSEGRENTASPAPPSGTATPSSAPATSTPAPTAPAPANDA